MDQTLKVYNLELSNINIIDLKEVKANLSANTQNIFAENVDFLDFFTEFLSQDGDDKIPIEFDISNDTSLKLHEFFDISVIEMQELDQNGLLFKNNSQNIISNNFITAHQITFENPIVDEQLTDFERIEELTLKVSSQPWIISPNLDRYEAKDNYGYNFEKIENNVNTNFLVTSDKERFADKELFESVNSNFINQKEKSRELNINQLEAKNCEHILSGQIIQECNAYEVRLQDNRVDNNSAISKYDSLSQVVKTQIINSIAIQKINDKDTIEISLHPKDLGHVKIKCDIKDNISINISVEKLTTLSLLQQNAHEIKEVLLKNLNNNLSADLSFNMGSGSRDNDQKSTYNTYMVEEDNNSNRRDMPNALMYLIHNGNINLVV